MIPHLLLPWSAKENAMSRRRRFSTSQRKRCDAFNKSRMRHDKNGRLRPSNPRCRAWAMENGRCRLHGGASTGPKSPEGKARVVAAMVAGRRAWLARRRAEGAKFAGGRKTGEEWITDAMQARAHAEARRLGAPGLAKLNRPLVLALLRSARGGRDGGQRAMVFLVDQVRRSIEGEIARALAVVNQMRAARVRRPSPCECDGGAG
jgi:hypothetical protein